VSEPIRVMVVDDHPMWRDGVSRDLAEAGYDVVAATGEGSQAVRIAQAVRPQVVVLDLQRPAWRPGYWCCRPAVSTRTSWTR